MPTAFDEAFEQVSDLTATFKANEIYFWAQKCADLDAKISKLVYELYGLTNDEIKIVEGGAK